MSRSTRRVRSRLIHLVRLIALSAAVAGLRAATAANITWTAGDGVWSDGAGNNGNWNPADEPDPDDVAIFNTNNSVQMTSNNTVMGLTMSNGIDLDLNNFDLTVAGDVDLTGATTTLIVGGANAELRAEDVDVNSGVLQLAGGVITIDDGALFGVGSVTISVGGAVDGFGTINLQDAPLAATAVVSNSGALTARTPVAVIGASPPANTLAINAGASTARIDLDGSSEAGTVNVFRNQTLDVNLQLSDAFNGALTMTQNTRLDMSHAWSLGAGGTATIDNGATGGILGAPAGKATIAGGVFTQSGGTITLVDNDGTLQFDAPFLMNGGNLVANGHVIFNADAVIGAGANFTRPTGSSNITVEAGRIVTINQPNFDLDGQLNTTSFITVNSGASLVANLGDYDPDQVTNSYSSTINLNNGDITVTTADPRFVMAGTLNMLSNVEGQVTTWDGEPLDIGNDSGVHDTKVNVSGNRVSRFGADVTFKSDADVSIASGATLDFTGAARFDGVNLANSAKFAGSGTLRFNGPVTVSEAITLDMAGGTVDLDGVDATGELIDVAAPLTINAQAMLSFGRINGAGGVNTLGVNNSVGTGVLTVNLDNPNAEWTLNAPGVFNLVNDNTEATLLAGNDVNINGTVNVTGDVRTTARLDIGSTALVNINTAGQPLRLAGGNETTDVNTIAGGTVSGVGILGADAGKALHGFGTISTQIDFDGSADLMADNGTLTIDGTKILDVETLGTADADGTLHVLNAWNNNVTAGVQLRGGTISGGTITNDTTAGISGHGLVTARIVNNTQLFASLGDTLAFQTAGNDNDWDGTTNTGEIEAVSANIELRDVGAAFGFTGTVRATNGHTAFANGFALDFNPGSTLSLASGGTYRSTSSTDLGGTVTVGVGGATINVENNFFLSFESGSSTTLGSDLTLKNNNIIIESGATFSGAGALDVPDGSHVVMENGANVNALVKLDGALRPGNSEGIGAVTIKDYQSSATSELFLETVGTALNQFDRLTVTGQALIDGFLSFDVDGGFVPALGNTFNVITATAGVFGTFDTVDVSGIPAGLAVHVNYLPFAVQLQIVNKPIFSADFDDDGDVDATDLAIWQGAFNLNQLGDADGDNDSDGADLLIWQRQKGSVPLAAVANSAASAVPEPASAVLVAAATLGLTRRRRRTA